MTDQIYQFALQTLGSVLLYGGSIAAAAYAIFRFFGEPWLKSKFDKQLEALKSGQEQELERLRFRINTLFDRATKLHQSEFEVLPEMWNRLVMAHNAIGAFTNEFQQYPVLDRMSDVELDEYLHGTALKPSEKDAIRQSGRKTNEYIKKIFGHRYVDSNTALRDYAVYLATKGIFLKPSMRDKFKELEQILNKALIEHVFNEREDIRPRERTARRAFQDRGEPLMKEIEADVESRLWSIEETV
ncbi:hypothetical protein [Mesorhizobium sp. M0006]|uniref:hypothetical protein n=1 Tax=Mesorhizobium sp. M0006 TaxID=2956838 RepID=UPI003335D3B6